VRGDQSADVLDLRMNCLENARAAFAALTLVFARADPAVLVEAINASHSLPSLERCSDLPALQAPLPPPADPKRRARLAELRVTLAEAKALADTAQGTAARHLLKPLAEEATAIGYEPFTAEVLSTSAWLETQSGAPEVAVPMFRKAVFSSLAAHRDDIALEAVAGLVGVDGNYLGRLDESRQWADLGVALVERLGPGHDRSAAWFYQGRAITHERLGEFRDALADLELALRLKERSLPRNHPDVMLTLQTLANVYNELGRSNEALVAANRAFEIAAVAYGSQSPLLGRSLDSRGEVLLSLGRYAEAETDLRRASDIFATWVGPENAWTAYPLTALGRTLLAEGRMSEAAPILERAVRIRERSEPNAELVAETRFALARALWPLGGERRTAKKLALAAREAYRKLPQHETQAGEIDLWLEAGGTKTAPNAARERHRATTRAGTPTAS